ncbi:hypothetical protein SPBR_01166 [Sporothrix brasiliensis 5110]|uniref:Uncharacterized protein n=1 Tax=Sporothrix brasiliensis 5110 TaxID=1398154 RepID=A0A0C2ISS2_9PEZI|nr:uncharacterized protein SPBR_01166 [Sporothrix brasiliensis 5110]KIH89900.1 hypothetical protein SPBR_01166 [Sporothrix brasiliensis 5110]
MYMDLVTVLCTLEDLKGFRMHSTVYCNLAPWLVRQVLGDRDPYKGGLADADVEAAFAGDGTPAESVHTVLP